MGGPVVVEGVQQPPPQAASSSLSTFYRAKIEEAELALRNKTQNLRRLEAQRNELNAKGEAERRRRTGCCSLHASAVRALREELQLLHEPGSYVGEVVKVMSKTKVLVKARLRRL